MPHLNTCDLQTLKNEAWLEHHIYISKERDAEAAAVQSGGNKRDVVLQRALHGFVVVKDDQPALVTRWSATPEFWADAVVYGYAASLEGVEGLCVQSGHWFEGQVKSELVAISGVQSIAVEAYPNFRGGERCLWLTAGRWKYALMSCFDFYLNFWQATLAGHLIVPLEHVEPRGLPPSWWPQKELSIWIRLQTLQLISKMPETRRRGLISSQSWHYGPGLPGRTPLAPPVIGLNLSNHSGESKRAADVLKEEYLATEMIVAADVEWQRYSKKFCLEDPNRLEMVMAQTRAMTLQPTAERPEVRLALRCCLDWDLSGPWDFGRIMPLRSAGRSRKRKADSTLRVPSDVKPGPKHVATKRTARAGPS